MLNPGRPREFDETDALNKIMNLFWQNGYEGTGLSDIIKATGLAKGSLYGAFGNKQSMYLKALMHYEQQVIDTAVAALRGPSIPPLERLDAFLSLPIAAIADEDSRGCFLCNASADRASLDEETKAATKRGHEKLRAALATAVAAALPGISTQRAERKAEVLLNVYTGMRIMSRAGSSVGMLESTVQEVQDSVMMV
ncbi:TetR/AcrR family transcriptional regulator [Yoonia sp. 2307UL14-13]|uniref:TetR/AcrR family transcriptional regulator n=1 Tax=Yoonia sp. 2307UL14-13 TaxID=3126506 RepID=UPI0030A7D603